MGNGFDLDAVLGENEEKPLTYKGKTFMLPAELPGACIAPFLRDELGLVDLITDVVAEAKDSDGIGEMLTAALKKRPTLPNGVLVAAGEAFKELLGPDAYEAFMALRPSVNALMAIARGVVSEYGVGLTDFFDLAGSSDTAGGDSKPTSPTTTPDSTPAASGAGQETPGS